MCRLSKIGEVSLKNRVLVMDARGNIGLSIIRSLGSKGIEVVAGDSFCFTTGSLSKYCADSLVYPPPEKDIEKFQKFILNEVKKKNS